MNGRGDGRIRVFLADDHVAVRAGIAGLLADESGLVVVGVAGDRDGTLHGVIDHAPDVCLLDLQMPGGGLALIRTLRAVAPAMAIVVFTMYGAEAYREHCLAAGAADFLNKGCAPDELSAVIVRAARGPRARPGSRPGRPGAVRTAARLSARETEVCVRLAAGAGVKEIAAELGVSVKTVSTFRARGMAKLGVSSTAELVRWAIAEGLA